MRFVRTCVIKDLRRLRRDPVMLLVWVGIPVFIAVLLTAVFGHGGTTPQGRLLVADQDGSFLSGALTGGFSREPLSKMVLVEKVPLAEGRRRIDRGGASALLIIPEGFGAAFLRRQPFQIQLITNPAQRIMPGIIQETLGMMLEAGHYLQSLAGDQLDAFTKGSPSDQAVVAINRLFTSLRAYLDPLLIQLDTQVVQEKTEPVNFGAIFFPSLLFMTMLFLSGGLGGELWKERAQGTLRRLAVTPGRIGAFLAGKVISAAVVFCAVSSAGLLAGAWLVDVPVHNAPLAVLWAMASGAALFLLLLLVLLSASSQRAASVLSNLAIFPLAMLGGSFFPFEVMPESFARIGRFTPNGWALIRFKAILGGSISPAGLAVAFTALAIAGGLLFLLAARRLRRAFLA